MPNSNSPLKIQVCYTKFKFAKPNSNSSHQFQVRNNFNRSVKGNYGNTADDGGEERFPALVKYGT